MGDDTPQLSLYWRTRGPLTIAAATTRWRVPGLGGHGLSKSQRELEAATAVWLGAGGRDHDSLGEVSAGHMSEDQLRDELGGMNVFAILGAAHRIEAPGEGRRR